MYITTFCNFAIVSSLNSGPNHNAGHNYVHVHCTCMYIHTVQVLVEATINVWIWTGFAPGKYGETQLFFVWATKKKQAGVKKDDCPGGKPEHTEYMYMSMHISTPWGWSALSWSALYNLPGCIVHVHIRWNHMIRKTLTVQPRQSIILRLAGQILHRLLVSRATDPLFPIGTRLASEWYLATLRGGSGKANRSSSLSGQGSNSHARELSDRIYPLYGYLQCTVLPSSQEKLYCPPDIPRWLVTDRICHSCCFSTAPPHISKRMRESPHCGMLIGERSENSTCPAPCLVECIGGSDPCKGSLIEKYVEHYGMCSARP